LEIDLEPVSHRSQKKLWGTLHRTERWGLSWRGRCIVVFVVFVLGLLLFWGVYPFLASTKRTNSDVLIVEGWVHEYAIRAVTEEFKTGSYQRIFTTGGPVAGTGAYTSDYNTSASVGADRLKKFGISPEVVQMVPSRVMGRDRTYSSAIALKDWFSKHDLDVRAFNIITEDVHARRTRLLFQKAFGESVEIGIIAVPNPDYDASHWWRYSEGVRDIIGEGIAYIYARMFFFPPKPDRIEAAK